MQIEINNISIVRRRLDFFARNVEHLREVKSEPKLALNLVQYFRSIFCLQFNPWTIPPGATWQKILGILKFQWAVSDLSPQYFGRLFCSLRANYMYIAPPKWQLRARYGGHSCRGSVQKFAYLLFRVPSTGCCASFAWLCILMVLLHLSLQLLHCQNREQLRFQNAQLYTRTHIHTSHTHIPYIHLLIE